MLLKEWTYSKYTRLKVQVKLVSWLQWSWKNKIRVNVPSLCTKQTIQNGLKGRKNIISVIKCDVKNSGSISRGLKGWFQYLNIPISVLKPNGFLHFYTFNKSSNPLLLLKFDQIKFKIIEKVLIYWKKITVMPVLQYLRHKGFSNKKSHNDWYGYWVLIFIWNQFLMAYQINGIC